MSRCDRARPWIVRCVDGDLAPGEALRFARHLDACTICRIVLARERRLAEMLEGLRDPVEVEPAFFEKVMASLPDRPARVALESSSRRRWRRGLKLAGIGGLVAVVGAAARILPAVHLDLAAPAMPRFAPESADGWLGLLGSTAQWVRVTAESLAWSGGAGSPGASAFGLVAVATATAGAVLVVAASLAVALAGRAGSRASS